MQIRGNTKRFNHSLYDRLSSVQASNETHTLGRIATSSRRVAPRRRRACIDLGTSRVRPNRTLAERRNRARSADEQENSNRNGSTRSRVRAEAFWHENKTFLKLPAARGKAVGAHYSRRGLTRFCAGDRLYFEPPRNHLSHPASPNTRG